MYCHLFNQSIRSSRKPMTEDGIKIRDGNGWRKGRRLSSRSAAGWAAPPTADIRAVSAFPRNVPRNLIAGNFVRVPQFETGDGLTTDVLDFDANVADNGSGEIDFQCLSFEDQRFGYQFASPIRRLHGDKAIGSQGMAPEVGGRLAVMLQVVNGYLLGSGRHDCRTQPCCCGQPSFDDPSRVAGRLP